MNELMQIGLLFVLLGNVFAIITVAIRLEQIAHVGEAAVGELLGLNYKGRMVCDALFEFIKIERNKE